jgi:hypothetical protein
MDVRTRGVLESMAYLLVGRVQECPLAFYLDWDSPFAASYQENQSQATASACDDGDDAASTATGTWEFRPFPFPYLPLDVHEDQDGRNRVEAPCAGTAVGAGLAH